MNALKRRDVESTKVDDGYNGYASAAAFIASDPDNETFVYRKFDQLGARNLLYLQCELLHLEQKLNRLDETTRASNDPDIREEARSWDAFTESFDRRNQTAVQKMELILKIRAKMKEYRTFWHSALSRRVDLLANITNRQMKLSSSKAQSQISTNHQIAFSKSCKPGST
jgi:hypothetical protein